jgi:hypothetical protein
MSLDTREHRRAAAAAEDITADGLGAERPAKGKVYSGKAKRFAKGRTLRQLVVGLLLIVVSAGVTAVFTAGDDPKPVTPKSPVVTLNKIGPNVGLVEAVSGTASNLADGDAVYILVKPAGDAHFYPQRGPCPIANGQFTCERVQFGASGAAGRKGYEVVVIRANGAAQLALLDYAKALAKNPKTPGLTAIPTGATEVARQGVTRVR